VPLQVLARQTPIHTASRANTYNIVSHYRYGLRFLLGSCHAAGAVTPRFLWPAGAAAAVAAAAAAGLATRERLWASQLARAMASASARLHGAAGHRPSLGSCLEAWIVPRTWAALPVATCSQRLPWLNPLRVPFVIAACDLAPLGPHCRHLLLLPRPSLRARRAG
jgi:hypothetical protein